MLSTDTVLYTCKVHGGKGVLVVENEQSDFTTVKTILGDGHWTKVAGTRVPNRDQQAFTSLLRHFINVLEGKWGRDIDCASRACACSVVG